MKDSNKFIGKWRAWRDGNTYTMVLSEKNLTDGGSNITIDGRTFSVSQVGEGMLALGMVFYRDYAVNATKLQQ